MLSSDLTPLSTRLLNGQETNCLFGSRRTTSMEGSARRTYLAAVAPPQPPPITTTRRPVFGPTVVAHPASPPAVNSPSPKPVPDVRRNCLRDSVLMMSLHTGCPRVPETRGRLRAPRSPSPARHA